MGLSKLKILFITILVTASVISPKIINIFGLIVPGAAICYAFTFLITDLISEVYGKKEANQLVKEGLFALIVSSFLIKLTQYLPTADFAQKYSDAYNLLLGINMRFVIASLISYYISQSIDVRIFHYLKEHNYKKWVRNNASTIVSQLIDTFIFIFIAFYGIVPELIWMAISQYILKIIIALLDTVPFYILTRNVKN